VREKRVDHEIVRLKQLLVREYNHKIKWKEQQIAYLEFMRDCRANDIVSGQQNMWHVLEEIEGVFPSMSSLDIDLSPLAFDIRWKCGTIFSRMIDDIKSTDETTLARHFLQQFHCDNQARWLICLYVRAHGVVCNDKGLSTHHREKKLCDRYKAGQALVSYIMHSSRFKTIENIFMKN